MKQFYCLQRMYDKQKEQFKLYSFSAANETDACEHVEENISQTPAGIEMVLTEAQLNDLRRTIERRKRW